jgi:hypothetical protein
MRRRTTAKCRSSAEQHALIHTEPTCAGIDSAVLPRAEAQASRSATLIQTCPARHRHRRRTAQHHRMTPHQRLTITSASMHDMTEVAGEAILARRKLRRACLWRSSATLNGTTLGAAVRHCGRGYALTLVGSASNSHLAVSMRSSAPRRDLTPRPVWCHSARKHHSSCV